MLSKKEGFIIGLGEIRYSKMNLASFISKVYNDSYHEFPWIGLHANLDVEGYLLMKELDDACEYVPEEIEPLLELDEIIDFKNKSLLGK